MTSLTTGPVRNTTSPLVIASYYIQSSQNANLVNDSLLINSWCCLIFVTPPPPPCFWLACHRGPVSEDTTEGKSRWFKEARWQQLGLIFPTVTFSEPLPVKIHIKYKQQPQPTSQLDIQRPVRLWPPRCCDHGWVNSSHWRSAINHGGHTQPFPLLSRFVRQDFFSASPGGESFKPLYPPSVSGWSRLSSDRLQYTLQGSSSSQTNVHASY